MAALTAIGFFSSNNYHGICNTGDDQNQRGNGMISIAKLVRDGERNCRKQKIQKRPGASRRQQEKGAHQSKEAGNCRKVE